MENNKTMGKCAVLETDGFWVGVTMVIDWLSWTPLDMYLPICSESEKKLIETGWKMIGKTETGR